jgi:hypothetical protein
VNGLFNVDVFYIHLCVLCMILYKRSVESEFNKIFFFRIAGQNLNLTNQALVICNRGGGGGVHVDSRRGYRQSFTEDR